MRSERAGRESPNMNNLTTLNMLSSSLCGKNKKWLSNNVRPPTCSRPFFRYKWALMWGLFSFMPSCYFSPSVPLTHLCLPSISPPPPPCFYMTLGLETSRSSVFGKQTDSSVCRSIPKAECSQWLFIRTKSLTQISTQQTCVPRQTLDRKKGWERG